jgi:hypothetical protein
VLIFVIQAVLVSMPSIEGSFGVAYGKGPHGWDSEEVAACKLAAGVLNALESYFWVSRDRQSSPLRIKLTLRMRYPRNTFVVRDWLTGLQLMLMKNLDW